MIEPHVLGDESWAILLPPCMVYYKKELKETMNSGMRCSYIVSRKSEAPMAWDIAWKRDID